MNMNKHIKTAGSTLAIAAGLFAALGAQGCRGDRSDKPPRQFFPDMDDQPRWKPQGETPFYANHRMMRETPANVVAFGRVGITGDASWGKPWAEQRVALLRDGDAVYFGYSGTNADGTPKYVDRIPASIEVTADFIKLGQTKFNIYCSVCHGFDGSGKGMVGQAWSYALPKFLEDPKYRDVTQYTGKDGYIFNVVRHGVTTNGEEKMPPYGHALNEMQAWAVVAYFRTLQEARSVPLSEVPESERPALEEKIRAAAAAAAAAAPAAPAATPAPAPTTPALPANHPTQQPQGGGK